MLLVFINKPLLLMKDFEIVREIPLQYRLSPFGRHMLLPGFDIDHFPFILDYGSGIDSKAKSDCFSLINLRTGYKDAIVHGSSQNLNQYPATFFVDRGNGRMDLHFCTTQLNAENTYEHTWHYMAFNADFTEILKKYNRLPINSIEEQMEKISKLSHLEVENRQIEELMKKDLEARA